MIKLKFFIGLAATACAMLMTILPANAEISGASKAPVTGGVYRETLQPGGAFFRCKTSSGTSDIKKNSPQEQSTKGPHLGLVQNLEGKVKSGTTTGACEIVISNIVMQLRVANPVAKQVRQPTLGQTTGLATNLEKTMKMVIEGASCEIVENPGANQNLSKTTIENNGANLKIKPEIKNGISTEAIGAGCALAGLKGGKEGSIELEAGETLEAKGIKEV